MMMSKDCSSCILFNSKEEGIRKPYFDLVGGVSMLAIIISALAYGFTTFATIKYVDERFQESIRQSTANYEKNRDLLNEIRGMLKTIDDRTWNMNGKK